MPAQTRQAKARNGQGGGRPEPKQATPKAVKTRKRGKKQENEEEKAEKVNNLQRYQEVQAAAYADCATPTGPSVNAVRGVDKPAAKATSNSRKSSKPPTKPMDKATGDIGDSSAMEVDGPPVFSGIKRTRANLSVDLSTQGLKECRSPARKRINIHPTQSQLTHIGGSKGRVNPFLNFEDEEQAPIGERETQVPEEDLPIEEEDGEPAPWIGEEDEGGLGPYVSEQDNEEEEREHTYNHVDENGGTQQESDVDGYTEAERGYFLEPEQFETQALEIESPDENFDGSGAQSEIGEETVATPRNRQSKGGRPVLRSPTTIWKGTARFQEPSPMEIDKDYEDGPVNPPVKPRTTRARNGEADQVHRDEGQRKSTVTNTGRTNTVAKERPSQPGPKSTLKSQGQPQTTTLHVRTNVQAPRADFGSQQPTVAPPCTTLKRSALNNARVLTNNPQHVAEKDDNNDNDYEELGGIPDHDECEGPEKEHAVNSPAKNGRRLNNKGMVKVEHPAPKTKKRRPRITVKDLPPDLTTDGDWQEFRRAFFAWMGASNKPWSNSDVDVADTLLVIGRTYKGNDYQLTTRGDKYVEVSQALQRVSEWRNTFGSTALWSLHYWFNERLEYSDSDANRIEWAIAALEDARFVYRVPPGPGQDGAGLFQHEVVLRTFATHLTAVKDVQWVKDLSSPFRKNHPRGALAIATAAVQRAVYLWATKRVSIEAIRTAQTLGRAIKLTRKPGTKGQDTAADVAFVKTKFGEATDEWMENAEGLTVKKMENIIQLAQEYVNKPGAATLRPTPPGITFTNHPNRRVLRDADDDEDDECDDECDDGDTNNNNNQHLVESQGLSRARPQTHPQPQASNGGLAVKPSTSGSSRGAQGLSSHSSSHGTQGSGLHPQSAASSRSHSTTSSRSPSTAPSCSNSAAPPRSNSAAPSRSHSAVPSRSQSPAPTTSSKAQGKKPVRG